METDRIKIIKGSSTSSSSYFDFDGCDLCDQKIFPQLRWHCEHDDPAHVTQICYQCLEEMGTILLCK